LPPSRAAETAKPDQIGGRIILPPRRSWLRRCTPRSAVASPRPPPRGDTSHRAAPSVLPRRRLQGHWPVSSRPHLLLHLLPSHLSHSAEVTGGSGAGR
jgi:hypothetical protein